MSLCHCQVPTGLHSKSPKLIPDRISRWKPKVWPQERSPWLQFLAKQGLLRGAVRGGEECVWEVRQVGIRLGSQARVQCGRRVQLSLVTLLGDSRDERANPSTAPQLSKTTQARGNYGGKAQGRALQGGGL